MLLNQLCSYCSFLHLAAGGAPGLAVVDTQNSPSIPVSVGDT